MELSYCFCADRRVYGSHLDHCCHHSRGPFEVVGLARLGVKPGPFIPLLPRLVLNCLMNDKGEAMELRFEKRFKGVTRSGVKFGMSANSVRKIYSDAGEMEWRGGGMKLIWPSRGILIWFHDNSVYQIVIFKPQR